MFALKNKVVVVHGVTNNKSIGFHIAKYLTEQCKAIVILLCQDEKIYTRHNGQLLRETGAFAAYPCDVLDDAQVNAAVESIKSHKGLHGYVHLVAATDPRELALPLTEVSRKNFLRTHEISCYSFIQMAGKLAPLMTDGGSMLTLSYIGASRPVLNYGLIGLAKASLEQSVRYLAADLGPSGIMVNALSTSPQDSVSGHMIPNHGFIGDHDEGKSLTGHRATYRGIAFAAAVHLDPQWEGTGQVDFVDCGSSVAHTFFPYGMAKMASAVERVRAAEEEATFAEARKIDRPPPGA